MLGHPMKTDTKKANGNEKASPPVYYLADTGSPSYANYWYTRLPDER